ncbi:hypothetical protein P691DRAFT_798157 [Macrolepiota fuliginosa MF-IS2]|uniref:Uncharacterized protein n=1 Tax=Macrolepiota fuliginosa MF-IS2 TaxID=1400762 RepID=A0A9P5X0M9_9AGAR|nr:hypothetical protein P691DRAFT_798157 [Macrolepiota fuliginosa MF-IS2]
MPISPFPIGQENGIDNILTHHYPSCLAVQCPACPEVDRNICLQHKKKNNDPLDKALNTGNAYFVADNEYQEYLKFVLNKLDNSICAKLKAVWQQEKSKFKDAVITGVVAIQCAHHGFYLPQGMVDLNKGEVYAKTDYALFHALGAECQCLSSICLSYDIWCQFSKHLVDHINHSFVYKPHSGMTCGKGIESTWSKQNHAATFTKEQNPGHRHDTLDDFNGYWNWTKLHQLCKH